MRPLAGALLVVLLAGCAMRADVSDPSQSHPSASTGLTGNATAGPQPPMVLVHIHGNLTGEMRTGQPLTSTTCAHDYRSTDASFTAQTGVLTLPHEVTDKTLAGLRLVVWSRLNIKDPTDYETCPADPPTAFLGSAGHATAKGYAPAGHAWHWNITLAPGGVVVNGTFLAVGKEVTQHVDYEWSTSDGKRVRQSGDIVVSVAEVARGDVQRAAAPAPTGFGGATDTRGYWAVAPDLA